MKTIMVTDESAAPVLIYAMFLDPHGFPSPVYFGGNVAGVDLDFGAHIQHHPRSLLHLIGHLANDDQRRYRLQGGASGNQVYLKPEMDADLIAGILDIEPDEVVKFYGLLVNAREKPCGCSRWRTSSAGPVPSRE